MTLLIEYFNMFILQKAVFDARNALTDLNAVDLQGQMIFSYCGIATKIYEGSGGYTID